MSGFNWVYVPLWYLKGSHGYTVSKSSTSGNYTAWPPSPGRPPSFGYYDWRDYVHHCIDVFLTAEEAKQACVDHYNEATK